MKTPSPTRPPSELTARSTGKETATRAAPEKPGKPGEKPGAKPACDGHVEMVGRACRYIDERLEGDGDSVVTLAELGVHCAMSPWHLQRDRKSTRLNSSH